MKEIKKFVDIELLRDKDVLLNGLITRARNDLAFKKGSLISITTKIDGSNFSVIYDPDENNLACFSRRLPLTGIDGLNGAVAYARKLDITPFKNHTNYRVFGEWLKSPKHNKIKYNDDMENRWIIYSIWDEDKEEWLLQDKVKDFCKEANLEYVEVLYEGPFISWDHCREFMKASKKYGPIQEGIVVRLQDEDRFDAQVYPKYPVVLKLVSDEFAEVMKHTRKPKDPEEEKRKQGAKGKAAELLSTVITENRVAKIISKLQEDEKLPRPLEDKDIGMVMKLTTPEVYKDIIKEEPETFEAAGEYASKVLGQITAVHVRKLILG